MHPSSSELKPLSIKKAVLAFAACWLIAWASVEVLRMVLIPREERACYDRVVQLQRSVAEWDRLHPSAAMRGDLDASRLVTAGLLPAAFSYDAGKHYYFVGETAHGWCVRCNRHEDNPLPLRLTGVTLLALLLWVVVAAWQRHTLLPSPA